MDHRSAGQVLAGSYDYPLVALSVLIAILAAHAALDLARQVTFARGRARLSWLIGGASAMGFGIWSMHYIGMLAFRLPIPVQYDWPTVLLSLLAAILASAIALFVVSRRQMSLIDAVLGSVLMGGGIATMHYVGMAAMRMQAMCMYSADLAALSVVLAIVISLVALWLTFHFRAETLGWSWLKTLSAVVMGLAIPVMHYTGMAAVTVVSAPEGHGDLTYAVSVSSLSVAGIAIVTFLVLGTALLAAFKFDALPTPRQLTARYFISLAAIGALAILGTLFVQYQGRQSQTDSHLINIAGRQRMIGQSIAKDALLLSRAADATERQQLVAELRRLVSLWEVSHEALQHGDPLLDLFGVDDPEIRELFAAHEPYFVAMTGTTRELIRKVASGSESVDIGPELMTILEHERNALETMNSIVFQYEKAARMRAERKDQLHLLLLLSILAVLLVQGMVVLRPALVRIQRGILQLAAAKQSLHRKATFVELLQVIAAAANEATSVEGVLQFAIDEICKRTGWPVGHVYMRMQHGSTVLVPTDLWHIASPTQFATLRDVTSRSTLTIGSGLPGRVAKSGKAAWVTDIYQDSDFPRMQASLELGVRGAFAFPVLAQGEVVAVLEFFSSRIEAPDEELLGVMANVGVQLSQVVERTRAQEKMAQNAEALARSNAELEQFAYVASHDLQEPLRMVASYTQLLARRYQGKLDDAADEFIGFAVDGATRMQTLIRDLLSYSRLTRKAPLFQPVEAGVSCEEACKNLQKSIEDSGAAVSIGRLPRVLGDATQLTQLFQNLIGNAIKYRDQRQPEIQVAARSNGDAWVFSVKDNGIGIDAQYSERIFQMFQRLHTRAEYPGTGIGLAICRKIVERHGGRIWVESQPGQGSTFLFTIPQAQVDRAPIGQPQELQA